MFLRSACLLLLSAVSLLAAEEEKLTWKALPDLPGKLGVAGPFAGVHNGALIVAGGANFPEGVPWRPTGEGYNSPKVYYDTIDVITPDGDGYKVVTSETKLPQVIGYGVSIPTKDGVICIGGEWKDHDKDEAAKKYNTTDHLSAKVFMLKHVDGVISVDTDFPDLPKDTTAASGALAGGKIYIAGGDSGEGATKNFWALDLAKRGSDDFKWEAKTPWDGPARTHLLAASQSDGAADCLYIFSGRTKDESGQWHMLSDAHKFNPKTDEWTKLPDIQPKGDTQPRCVMAGTASAVGANSLLIFGGANGQRFITLEGLSAQIAAATEAGNTQAAATLEAEKQKIQDEHVGFSRDILIFNTITGQWREFAKFKEDSRGATAPGAIDQVVIGSHVTTTAVKWGNSIIIPSGESSPGIRTPNIWKIDLAEPARNFGAANWVVLTLYMGVLIGIGVFFSRRNKSAEDFFVAGKRVVWWAAEYFLHDAQRDHLSVHPREGLRHQLDVVPLQHGHPDHGAGDHFLLPPLLSSAGHHEHL